MANWPSVSDLESALRAAGQAHHDYQSGHLGGVHDEQWAGWYAAYTLGRVGDFISPTELTKMLVESPGGDDWAGATARHVAARNPADL